MGLHDAFTQVLVVGLIAFCCPGLFNALTGLGGAGSKDTKIANSANTALYACFAIFGFFGGPCFNLFGNRLLMFGGGLTYAFYAAGIYISGKVPGADWVSILAGALLGVGAGLFWTSQGAMMMAYATPAVKGKYIAWFWILFNMGGVFGGLLAFGINFDNTTGSDANPAAYFTFVALMALGSFCALILLVPASTVRREDGAIVHFSKAGSAFEEIRGAIKVCTNINMLLLTCYFLASNWYYTYQLNFVNGWLFNQRSNGLNSALYWLSQVVSAFITGKILDKPSMRRSARAKAGFWWVTFVFIVAWICGICLQYAFEGGYDKDNRYISPDGVIGTIENPIDVTESSRAWKPIMVLILYAFADAAMQPFAYWIMGAVAGSDTALSARFAGYYKGVQSAGAAVAWGLDLHLQYRTQLWISFALWALGTPLCWFAVLRVPDYEPDMRDDETEAESEWRRKNSSFADRSAGVSVARTEG